MRELTRISRVASFGALRPQSVGIPRPGAKYVGIPIGEKLGYGSEDFIRPMKGAQEISPQVPVGDVYPDGAILVPEGAEVEVGGPTTDIWYMRAVETHSGENQVEPHVYEERILVLPPGKNIRLRNEATPKASRELYLTLLSVQGLPPASETRDIESVESAASALANPSRGLEPKTAAEIKTGPSPTGESAAEVPIVEPAGKKQDYSWAAGLAVLGALGAALWYTHKKRWW